MEYQVWMAAEAEKWVARLNAHVHGASRSRPAASAQYWLLGKIGSWATGPGRKVRVSQEGGRWPCPLRARSGS